MKVQELRDHLKKADREKVEKAFVESYKQLSKAKKEETDQIIIDILSGNDLEKRDSTQQKDFITLKQEVEEFIGNAYAQNYYTPNRVIPKSKRPKWRFLVKGYIKEFLKIKAGDIYYPEMIVLFTDLYKMLCEACNYYLFSTEDPFRSVGWRQPELFGVLVKKAFEDGYKREKISAMMKLAVSGGVSPDNLSIEQGLVLCSELKTSDVKYMAIEEIKKLVDGEKAQLTKMKNNSDQRYFIKEKINHLCDLLLVISMELAEVEEGCVYYFNHCIEREPEIVLYRALRIVEWTSNDDKVWVDIYRYGLTKKIKPRESLTRQYHELLQEEKAHSESEEM